MSATFPSFIPISDVLRLIAHLSVGDKSAAILDSALYSGVMTETRGLIDESKRMIQIKTDIDGDVSQKILSREKWGEIKDLLMTETIVVGYDYNDEKICGQEFLQHTKEKSIHPDCLIGRRISPVDESEDSGGAIDVMLELVAEHQSMKLKQLIGRQNDIKKQKEDKENIRMRLLTTDQPQNIIVKKVDGHYVVQNSFKFVLDPPKERLVVGIYNSDKTIRTKLSDEEIQTCTILKLKIKKDDTITVVPDKVDEKADSSNDDLSPFGSPTYSSILPHPMLFTKPYHKYVSYLNILSLLYNTDDGFDDEVWTDDLINRVDARLHGTEIGPGSSARKIEILRNMGTSYQEVCITSKNQPNKRSYKISSDHTLTDILEGTRVFAGKNTVIDSFDVDERETNSDRLSLVINWLH